MHKLYEQWSYRWQVHIDVYLPRIVVITHPIRIEIVIEIGDKSQKWISIFVGSELKCIQHNCWNIICDNLIIILQAIVCVKLLVRCNSLYLDSKTLRFCSTWITFEMVNFLEILFLCSSDATSLSLCQRWLQFNFLVAL